MSLAFTTLAVIAFILPGLGYFFGFHSHERLPRDFGTRNPLGELAAASFVAATIHVVLLGALRGISSMFDYQPLANVVSVILAIQSDVSLDVAPILNIVFYICIYLLSLTAITYSVGYFVGTFVVAGRFPFLVNHPWILPMTQAVKEGPHTGIQMQRLTIASVMTKIQSEQYVLMYKGYLSDFYFDKDGKVSYLLIYECSRFYIDFLAKPSALSQTWDSHLRSRMRIWAHGPAGLHSVDQRRPRAAAADRR